MVALALFGFVSSFDQSAPFAVLTSSTVKLALGAAVLGFAAIEILVPRQSVRISTAPAIPVAHLSLYVAWNVVATLAAQVHGVRLQVLGILAISTIGLIAVERTTPGSWVRIVYTVSLAHITITLLAGSDRAILTDAHRLEAGSSGVLVGFEALMVILVSAYFFVTNTRHRWFFIAGGALGLIALLLTFSRAALISAMISIAILLVFATPRHRVLRSAAVAVLGYLAYSRFSDDLIARLSGGNADSLYTASGRYTIWDAVLANFQNWGLGLGFTPLHDATNADQSLFAATGGLPVENALLQALITGGVVCAALWLLLALRGLLQLWRLRGVAHGLSVAMIAPLVVSGVFSVGLSGVGYEWWWLLFSFSLARSPATTRAQQRSSGRLAVHNDARLYLPVAATVCAIATIIAVLIWLLVRVN
jgi:hypothetical protein